MFFGTNIAMKTSKTFDQLVELVYNLKFQNLINCKLFHEENRQNLYDYFAEQIKPSQ